MFFYSSCIMFLLFSAPFFRRKTNSGLNSGSICSLLYMVTTSVIASALFFNLCCALTLILRRISFNRLHRGRSDAVEIFSTRYITQKLKVADNLSLRYEQASSGAVNASHRIGRCLFMVWHG